MGSPTSSKGLLMEYFLASASWLAALIGEKRSDDGKDLIVMER